MMRIRPAAVVGAILTLSALNPRSANGQASDTESSTRTVVVSTTATFLVSVQPADHTDLGVGPYLFEALSGVGPGFAMGLTVMTPGQMALAAEFSTARIVREQSGRNVGGQATGRLRDSMISGLVGFGTSSRSRTLLMVVGLSRILDAPSLDNVSIDRYTSRAKSGRLGLTLGGDAFHAATPRVSLGGSIRYSLVLRNRRAVQIGVGEHLFRVGASVRFRVR